MGELLIFDFFPASRFCVSDKLDTGSFSCRASIPIAKFLKPKPHQGASPSSPMTMLEVTESLVSVLSRSESARKGGDSDDVGCAKEKDRASQEEDRKAKENVSELARQKIAAEKVPAKTVTAAEAELVWAKEAMAKETATEEVATSRAAANEVMAEEAAPSRAAANEVAAEEAATARALSGQAGQGESHEAAEEVVDEAPASAGMQGSQEIAAGASSNVASEPGEGTGMPMPEEKTGEAVNLTCTGADAGPGDASQGSLMRPS
jgi:hypothetical protein